MFAEKSDRPSFELFRSNTRHKLKAQGILPFITQLLISNQIRTYYERKRYPEDLYLLSMLDHLSKLHDIPLCCNYNNLRNAKLAQPLYPSEFFLLSELLHSDLPKKEAPARPSPNICGSISWSVIDPLIPCVDSILLGYQKKIELL